MDTLTSIVSLITICVIVYMVFLKKNNSNTTDCHPKTDNFDFWCLKEVGKNFFLKNILNKGCSDEQVKASCTKGSK